MGQAQAAGVTDSFLNPLVIEIGYLFAEMEKRRRSRSSTFSAEDGAVSVDSHFAKGGVGHR